MKPPYFSHEYYARLDENIIKLMEKLGWEGYGLYWGIVEKLYHAEGFLTADYNCIAYELRTQCERIQSIINDFGLFEFEGDLFYSVSVLKRLDIQKKKSETSKKAAETRWVNNQRDLYELQKQSENEINYADAMQMQCERNTVAMPIKLNNIKLNNKNKDITVEVSDEIPLKKKVFQKPTMDEICKYLIEHNEVPKNQAERLTEKFYNFYESKDWYVGKNKMKNWKAAATNSLTWKD